MQEPMPADRFRQSRIDQARETLAVLDDGGCAAVVAHIHGQPLSPAEGMNEAYTVGVLTGHVRALLDVLDEDRNATQLAVEAIYNAGVKAGQESAS